MSLKHRTTIGTCISSLVNPFLKYMPIVGQRFVFIVKSFLSYSLILLSLADIFLLLSYFSVLFCFCSALFCFHFVFALLFSLLSLSLLL